MNSSTTEAPAWYFDNIATLSHSARNIHIVYVGFLAYCALTMWSTAPRRFILNEEARLPIINMDVPLSRFVIAAPLVAIFVFVYFQLHLHVLKRAIVEVGADYEKPAKGRMYPWMIHLAEEPEIGALGKLQRIMVHFSLWWLLPIVLLLFVLFTLRQHNDSLSYFQLLIFCIGIVLVFWLHNRYREIPTKEKDKNARHRVGASWMEKHPKQLLLGVAAFALTSALVVMVPEKSKLRMDLFDVDLSNQVLIRDEKERSGIFWAYFQGMQLQRANLANTVLTRANLNEANLYRVNLQGANLDSASLWAVHLEEATLSNASLKGANLRNANMAKANLICSDLSDADLTDADFSGAILINANVSNRMTRAQLSSTRSLYGVALDKDVQAELQNQKPDLFEEPQRQSDIVARYHATEDTQPISKWRAEPLPPPSEASYPFSTREVRHQKSMDELKQNDPVYSDYSGDRLFEKDFIALIRRDPYSVAEVRFFVTKKKIDGPLSSENYTFYIQANPLSGRWFDVPCQGSSIQKTK